MTVITGRTAELKARVYETFDVNAARADFPIFARAARGKPLTYLDSAASAQKPDAVIAANDTMAIGCIDEARAMFGLEVPGDMSVVGFDGVGPSAYAAYRLTTVSQPVAQMSEAAVSMLTERIENLVGTEMGAGSRRRHGVPSGKNTPSPEGLFDRCMIGLRFRRDRRR